MSKKKPISIASRKGKSRILQYWACEQISQLTDIPWDQDDDDSLIRSRSMGQKGVDVILRREALKLFPMSVECKRQESWSVPAWIEQTQKNQAEGTDWLLIAKRSQKRPVVIMDAEVFFTKLKLNRYRRGK